MSECCLMEEFADEMSCVLILSADDALPIRIWFTKDKTGDGSTDNFPIPADVIAFDASDIRETMWWVVLSDKNWVTVHAMTTNQTEEKVWEYYILYFRDKGVMQVRLLDSKNAKIEDLLALLICFFFQVKEFLPHTPLLRRVSQIPTTPVPAVLPLLSTTPQSSPTTPMPYSPLPTTPRYSPETPTASFESLSKWRETLAMILANHAPGDSQAITGLGDILRENGWICAAHVW